MRDGVELSTDLYLPAASGPVPAVLLRTPYDNTLPSLVAKGRRLAEAGYAVAIQDVRGRFDSDGVYSPFASEGPDGYDTQAWIAAQPWSNGRIGLSGRSYAGWTQWTSAVLLHPSVRAIAPRAMAPDLYRGLAWRGGAFNIGVLMTWGLMTSGRSMQEIGSIDWRDAFRTLPLMEAAAATSQDLASWRAWLTHTVRDEYWQAFDFESRLDEIQAPALLMGGWYDLYADDMLRAFARLREVGGTTAARHSRIVVGPWPHALSESTLTGELDFGSRSQIDLEALEERWFDRWLKDEATAAESTAPTEDAPLRLFIMGTNVWRDEHEWPLARTDWQRWYLHSDGRANTLVGDGTLSRTAAGEEPVDHFVYHPDFPVPTNGGPNCCSPELVPWGAYDQRDLEMRTDVLCFTSEPLTDDLEVTGPVSAVIWAVTDGRDTDWTAKLVDVWPNGRAMNLCDGIIRARFRKGFEREVLLDAGAVERYEIDLMATSNVFRSGHRIRLEVSSSNFPRFDRNPNTSDAIGMSAEVRAARQSIWHTGNRASYLLLPVIPA